MEKVNSKNRKKWFDKLFNVKYLTLFQHFKAIYQFPKHIIFLVKIVANAPLIYSRFTSIITNIQFYKTITKNRFGGICCCRLTPERLGR
jgi:hypothetical protein